MPSSRRISVSACRPLCSIFSSVPVAGLARGPCSGRLQDHHAEVMGDDVVQLTGDPGPLRGHRLLGLAL